MTRVLLTGGNSFIAGHVLDQLLAAGHSIVTTVRSQDKADIVLKAHQKAVQQGQLSTAIVKDITKLGAFDEAVISDPPFEAVIHMASPFHYNVQDVEKDFLDPAVKGTTGILKSIAKSAPTVKRVVITSSNAAVIDPSKGFRPGYTYSGKDWAPITREAALENPKLSYRASKVLAERAAWDFVEQEKPNFTLATILPSLVFGPIVEHYLTDLDKVNTSNKFVLNVMRGPPSDTMPKVDSTSYVHVYDTAKAHVRAMEVPEAANTRFFIPADKFGSQEVVEIIRKNFPEYAKNLPPPTAEGGRKPSAQESFTIDHSDAVNILGLEYLSLETAIIDTVNSLKKLGA